GLEAGPGSGHLLRGRHARQLDVLRGAGRRHSRTRVSRVVAGLVEGLQESCRTIAELPDYPILIRRCVDRDRVQLRKPCAKILATRPAHARGSNRWPDVNHASNRSSTISIPTAATPATRRFDPRSSAAATDPVAPTTSRFTRRRSRVT